MMKLKSKPLRQRRSWLLTLIILASALVFDGLAIGGYYWWQQTQIDRVETSARVLALEADGIIAAIEAKKKEPVYITLPGAEPIEAMRHDYNQPDSLWAMANKERALPMDYVPAGLAAPNLPLRSGSGSQEMWVRGDVAAPLEAMFAAAAKDGHNLMVGSAYRSSITQTYLFNGYVASAGLAQASMYSARPGHSEHQLGLSVDISSLSQNCYLQECFTSTIDGQWLANNAYKYGFALRYMKGKEAITGYNFEPWHYRYVGVQLATALHQSGLALEEAWPYLTEALETLKNNRAL